MDDAPDAVEPQTLELYNPPLQGTKRRFYDSEDEYINSQAWGWLFEADSLTIKEVQHGQKNRD